jgi:hypothetical protein
MMTVMPSIYSSIATCLKHKPTVSLIPVGKNQVLENKQFDQGLSMANNFHTGPEVPSTCK